MPRTKVRRPPRPKPGERLRPVVESRNDEPPFPVERDAPASFPALGRTVGYVPAPPSLFDPETRARAICDNVDRGVWLPVTEAMLVVAWAAAEGLRLEYGDGRVWWNVPKRKRLSPELREALLASHVDSALVFALPVRLLGLWLTVRPDGQRGEAS